MAKKANSNETSPSTGHAARDPENRENQLINLAYTMAEKRLKDGTASAQEIVHFLKMGTAKAQLEKKKLEAETQLLESKKEAVDSAKQSAAAYQEAMDAFKAYSGQSSDEELS